LIVIKTPGGAPEYSTAMDPLESLSEEHRQIRVVISAITSLLDLTRGDRRISPTPFLELQAFIMQFADGSHHAKEEQVLFSEMVQAGLPNDSGPLASILNEHDQGRKYAAVLGAAARACVDGQWHRQVEMVDAARAWCQLVNAHTDKEDLMLYAIAQTVIPDRRLALLPALFAKVDPLPASAFKDAANAVVEAAERAAHTQRKTG